MERDHNTDTNRALKEYRDNRNYYNIVYLEDKVPYGQDDSNGVPYGTGSKFVHARLDQEALDDSGHRPAKSNFSQLLKEELQRQRTKRVDDSKKVKELIDKMSRKKYKYERNQSRHLMNEN